MEHQVQHQEMIAKLHATDHRSAQEAVQFFVAHRMPAPLIERLKVGGNDVRVAAVKGLAAIGDKSALPAIADLLEAERHPVRGSEQATMHKILKETALLTASHLAGETLDVKDVNDEEQILAAVRRIRAKHRPA